MFGSLLLLFILNMFRATSEMLVGAQLIAVLSVSFLLAAFIRRKDTFNLFVGVTYLETAAYLLVQFFKA